jgi:hypothetical protein
MPRNREEAFERGKTAFLELERVTRESWRVQNADGFGTFYRPSQLRRA